MQRVKASFRLSHVPAFLTSQTSSQRMSPPARRPRRLAVTGEWDSISGGPAKLGRGGGGLGGSAASASPLLCLERDRGRAEVHTSQRHRTERLNSRVWFQMKCHSCRERIVRGWQFWRPVDSAPFLEEESR